MFIFLSKFLQQFAYPLGMVFCLLALALVLQRRRRWQNVVLGLALFLLFLSGNRWTAMGLARSLEWQNLPLQPVPEAEVIVVLGGATDPLQYPRSTVEINSAGDRVLYAAYLYHAGKAPHILLSGGNIEWLSTRASSPAEEMAEIMGWLGVPGEALWLQTESRNTYEDALYSRRLLEEKGVQRILLVTSALHMPRSLALFEAQGLEVIPAPADFIVTEESWRSLVHADPTAHLVNLLPSVGNVGLTTNALKEYLGMLVYRLQGWL